MPKLKVSISLRKAHINFGHIRSKLIMMWFCPGICYMLAQVLYCHLHALKAGDFNKFCPKLVSKACSLTHFPSCLQGIKSTTPWRSNRSEGSWRQTGQIKGFLDSQLQRQSDHFTGQQAGVTVHVGWRLPCLAASHTFHNMWCILYGLCLLLCSSFFKISNNSNLQFLKNKLF